MKTILALIALLLAGNLFADSFADLDLGDSFYFKSDTARKYLWKKVSPASGSNTVNHQMATIKGTAVVELFKKFELLPVINTVAAEPEEPTNAIVRGAFGFTLGDIITNFNGWTTNEDGWQRDIKVPAPFETGWIEVTKAGYLYRITAVAVEHSDKLYSSIAESLENKYGYNGASKALGMTYGKGDLTVTLSFYGGYDHNIRISTTYQDDKSYKALVDNKEAAKKAAADKVVNGAGL